MRVVGADGHGHHAPGRQVVRNGDRHRRVALRIRNRGAIERELFEDLANARGRRAAQIAAAVAIALLGRRLLRLQHEVLAVVAEPGRDRLRRVDDLDEIGQTVSGELQDRVVHRHGDDLAGRRFSTGSGQRKPDALAPAWLDRGAFGCDGEFEIPVGHVYVERRHADAREAVERTGFHRREIRPPSHDDGFDRRIRQHVRRDRNANGRRALHVVQRSCVEHVVTHHRDVNVRPVERRGDQHLRRLANLVRLLVQVDVHGRGLRAAPIDDAGAEREGLNVRRTRVALRPREVRADAIRAGVGRLEAYVDGAAARRRVGRIHGCILDGFVGLIAAFDGLRRRSIRHLLQLDVDAASGNRLAVRVGHDRADRKRRSGRDHAVGREPDRRVARKGQERGGVVNGEMRDVRRLDVHRVRHGERQIRRHGHVERCGPVLVERQRALRDVGRDRGLLLGPEPLRSEPVIVPSLGRKASRLARNRRLCRTALQRRSEQVRRFGVGAHRRARRGRRLVQRERERKIRRLEFGDAERSGDHVSARAFAFDRVISERLMRAEGQRQREHAVAIARHGLQRFRISARIFEIDAIRGVAIGENLAVRYVVRDAGQVARFARLVHVAVGEENSARERRAGRPSAVHVEIEDAAPIVGHQRRVIRARRRDDAQRRRLVRGAAGVTAFDIDAAKVERPVRPRHAARAARRRDAGIRRDPVDRHRDRAGRRAVAQVRDANHTVLREPLRENAEVRELHEPREDGRALRIDGRRETVGQRAVRAAQKGLKREAHHALFVAGRRERVLQPLRRVRQCGRRIEVAVRFQEAQNSDARRCRAVAVARQVRRVHVEIDRRARGNDVDARRCPDARREIARLDRDALLVTE